MIGGFPLLASCDFEVIEFEGQDHIGALATTDPVAPQLAAALSKTGW